jgi:hypothetical protein
MIALQIAARFLRRSRQERRLLVVVAGLFVAAHVLLRCFSLHATRSRLHTSARLLRAHAGSALQLAWATDRVNDSLPGRHSCLVNALVCDVVAQTSGITSNFRIGAARHDDRHRFHAWVEHDGVVIAGHDHAGFVPLG